MKNVSFILWNKSKWTFWPTQYIAKGRNQETNETSLIKDLSHFVYKLNAFLGSQC